MNVPKALHPAGESAVSATAKLTGGRAVALVATLILGVLSYQLNASMVTPALPDIARSLGEDVGAVSQVTSLFFLAGALGGIVLSRWSDYIGRRRALIVVLGILALGTALCIVAPNLPLLLVGRVLQGASSAAFQLAYIIIRESLSAKAFGTTLGVITAVNGGAGGVDGYVGGLLADRFGYQSIFAVIFVFGLLAFACVFRVVPKTERPPSTGRLDWAGSATLSIALICVTYFVSQGPVSGWLSPGTLLYLAGAAVALVVFVLVEQRRASPLIAVSHLRSRQVWPVLATTVLALAGIFAVINFTVVLLSQNTTIGFGMDSATSGLLVLTPAALIGVVSAPAAGWLASKYGWLRMLRLGLALSVLVLLALIFTLFVRGAVIAEIALLGITYNGLVLTTVNGLGVLQSPPEAPAALPGLNGAAFGIGAGLGIGIVAPFAGHGTAEGFTTALAVSAGIALLALLTSLLIRPSAGHRVQN